MQQAKKKSCMLSRYVPILHWLPHYNKAWLSGDIVAGLSVWALMVPQCLGFAAICGVPVQCGLYADAIALIVYAFFASSHHVVTGPSSTIAAVTGAARQCASKYHYDIDINQEMLAQGMANLGSGFFQGINAAGSLSKSSVNDASGAKSEMASLAQGVFVILTLLFLARVKHEVMEMLEKDGVDKIIGRDHIHNKVVEAVQWFTQKKKPGTKNDR